jgi:hypothetical protein
MIDLTPTITEAPAIDLAAQFRLCEQWQDADQWEALGDLYYQRYGRDCTNAKYCWRKCDELRIAAADAAERSNP